MASITEDRKQAVTLAAAWNGTGTAPTGSVIAVSSDGGSVLSAQIVGAMTATVQFEGTIDQSNWFAITGTPITGGATVTSATAAGQWNFQYAGLRQARARCSAYTSGSPVVTLNVSSGPPSPTGSATTVTGTVTALGSLTNNSAAPAATNVGSLVSLANAAAPSYTEGRQVLLSSDLAGNVRAIVQGQQANGVVITENPVLIGQLHSDNTVRLIGNAPTNVNASGTNLLATAHEGVAVAHGANPSAVTAGNYQTTAMNRHAIPFVIGGHPNVVSVTANFTAAQTDFALVTVAAGLKIVLTGFLVTAHNANSVNVAVVLGFGTANTPALTANTAIAAVPGSHPGIAPGSGFGRGGGAGIIGVGADNEDLRVTVGVPTGGSLSVTASYYTIES